MILEQYMQRSLELAERGLGKVAPNPLVGCVIVYNDQIIGEGYHQGFGMPHAEVEAIRSVEDKSLLKEATLYVNLEPCCHHGKTPPCTNLIIENEIPTVIIANEDPFPEVSGQGINQLKEAGIKVHVGLLSEKARRINRRFFTFHEKNRPYVILKWAETADGFIDKLRANGEKGGFWITSAPSKKLSHKWRTEENAILVGARTAINDNPSLTARKWSGSNPTRIVIDLQGTLKKEGNLFNDDATTLMASTNKELADIFIDQDNWIEEVLRALRNRSIQSVIVEGGAATLEQFIKQSLFDEIRLFRSNHTINEGLPAPGGWNGNLFGRYTIGSDSLFIYHR